MVASEAVPLAKTGGLADVVGALSRELVRLGHDVKLVLPRYQDFGDLVKDLKNTRDALDVICAMIGADFGTAAGFAAPFEEEYAKMSANLHKIVEAGQAVTDKNARESGERPAAEPLHNRNRQWEGLKNPQAGNLLP